MTRLLSCLALVAGLFALTGTAADKKDVEKTKAALGELGDFIGQWNLNGEDAKKALSKEVWTWGWKFPKKETDPLGMAIEIKDGKVFTGGFVTYDLDKKEYKFALTGKDGKAQDFTGKLAKGVLKIERTDSNKDVYKLSINTAANGIRLVGTYEVVTGGKGLGTTIYKVSGSKEGESIAGGGKKNECIVTGGAGTIAVSALGRSFFVCCSGCRDEFNANPKKYIDEFDKNKGKK